MSQLNQHVERVVDGQVVKVPLPQPPEHKNPSLQALNAADGQARATEAREIEAVVRAGQAAMHQTAVQRSGRRQQKMLRAPQG
jgi:hypothetical protein